MKIRKFAFALGAAMATASALAPSVHAQTEAAGAAGETSLQSSGWTVQCENNGDALQCAASLSIVAPPQNQLVFSISFQEAEGSETPNLVMQLPFGLNLPRGIDVSVDDADVVNFEIGTCLQSGCFVIQPANQEIVDQFVAGATVSIVMYTSDGGSTPIELPLEGFSAALDRLN